MKWFIEYKNDGGAYYSDYQKKTIKTVEKISQHCCFKRLVTVQLEMIVESLIHELNQLAII